MRMFARAAALICASLAAASVAIAFEDPATGFKIDVPAPYEAQPMSGRPGQVSLAIAAIAGGPQPVMGMPQLCAVAFETTPSGPQYATPDEIKAAMATPAYLAEVGVNEALLENPEQSPFTLEGGVPGIELEGQMAGDPGIRFYFAIARAPAGQATLTCAVGLADLQVALVLFRRMRDGMVLPQ